MSEQRVRAISPDGPPRAMNWAARSREVFAAWTRLRATSMLMRVLMLSRREAISAAFAASSSVGASAGKEGVRARGIGLAERELGFNALSVCLIAGLLEPENEGKMLTGIMTTFLKDAMKSFLSAWRLNFDISKLSVVAACSCRFRSQR